MSKSILIIDTPEDCRDCMIRDLTGRCQATGKDVDEYRHNKCRPEWCPLVEEDREIAALENMIPKKMKTVCPDCGTHIKRCYYHCPGCGQAIDWNQREV